MFKINLNFIKTIIIDFKTLMLIKNFNQEFFTFFLLNLNFKISVQSISSRPSDSLKYEQHFQYILYL